MSDEKPLHDDTQREALIRKLRNLVALTIGQRTAIADGWEREAARREELEAEVEELRERLLRVKTEGIELEWKADRTMLTPQAAEEDGDE